MAHDMKWYYISLSYATYAIGVENGVVKEAPPIARWMVGKTDETVAKWLKKKNAKIQQLGE